MFEEFTKKLTKVMKGMESFSDGDYNLPAYKKMDEKIGDLLEGIKAKYINQGSSRVTYRLNKDYVIKLRTRYLIRTFPAARKVIGSSRNTRHR